MSIISIVKSVFFSGCILSLLSACINPPVGTYTTDPSRKEDKVPSQEVALEVFVVNSHSEPVTKMKIKAKTKDSSKSSTTNFKGRTRMKIQRTDSEPIKFIFKKDGFTSIEVLHHLPSRVSSVGLLFEMTQAGHVRFSNYTIKGLHR
jgi:hypothetical protein